MKNFGEELQKRIDGYNNEIRSLQSSLLPLQEEYTQQLALTAKKSMLDIGRPRSNLSRWFWRILLAISKMTDAYKSFGDETN